MWAAFNKRISVTPLHMNLTQVEAMEAVRAVLDAAVTADPRKINLLDDTAQRQGISDERVLAAIETVPRELFVEDAFADQAYADQALADVLRADDLAALSSSPS